MASTKGSGSFSIGPQGRVILGLGFSGFALLATVLCVLLVLHPSPPFPPPTPESDSPKPPPPPTFTPTPTQGPKATQTPTPSPTPITVGWRELGYLTTIEYVGKVVVEEKGKTTFWGTDWVVLEVTGKVQMGVDMTQIRDSDVVVEGTSIEVVLPRPTVISVELVPGQTHAYVDNTKILFSEFSDLQIQAIEKAQTQLRDWYGNDETWITLAEEMTRRRLDEFLHQLGFRDIEVVFRQPTRL